MKKLFLIFLVAGMIFQSCKPKQGIYFEEPQPKNEQNQQRFKNRFLGTWLNVEDSSLLYITRNMLVEERNYILTALKKELDTMPAYKIRHDSIFGEEFGNGTRIKTVNDTVFIFMISKDTIFMVSDEQILRFNNGNYFLNHRIGEKQWMVEKMSMSGKNQLVIADLLISEKDSLKNFTEVKEIPKENDSAIVDYYLNPTRKELKSYIREGGFREKKKFIRIMVKMR